MSTEFDYTFNNKGEQCDIGTYFKKASTTLEFIVDGAPHATTTVINGGSIPTGQNCYLLGGNTNGSLTNAREGAISMFYTGGGVGFDDAGFTSGVRQFLIDLGVTGVPTP